MRKWLILLLSALFMTTASGAPAWTWVDNDGQVHFSDRPVPGATKVDLAGAQGFGGQARAAESAATPSPQSTPAARPATNPYRVLNIVNPTQQQTLWNIGATLPVTMLLAPGLQAGHRVDVAVDGQRKNLNATSLQVNVPGIFRGTHTLEALVVDATGAELTRSGAVTIIVQQTSTQNPNSLPGRRRQGGN